MRAPRIAVSLVLIASLLAAPSALAELKLPAVISDGMVLQRDMRVPIWGTADPGQQVTVTVRDQRISATAGPDGRWVLQLKPLKPGGPFSMTVSGGNIITVSDVLVGDVWVCSGQSNMAWALQNTTNAQQDIAAANHPRIRLFKVKNVVGDKPLHDTEATWQASTPETARAFSAVGYFFGRDLHRELHVPIGLIGTYWGGTPAEAWTSRATLEANPELHAPLDRWDEVLANYPKAKANYDQRLAQWQENAPKLRAEGKPVPRRPRAPRGPGSPHAPGGLFNGMISPLLPYAIKGAIWYQGESNAGRAYQYRKIFPAMIRDWRRNWGQGAFPFMWVQLPNFREYKAEPGDSDWAELREAQLMTLALPNTAMAIIIELGEARDIHPKNKAPVGRRLALAALGTVYGEDIVHSGPIYKSMTVEGRRARLRFRHIGGGLVAKGGPRLRGFTVAAADRTFYHASAHIDGNTVVVSSAAVRNPVAVRYAWADNPVCNLYNAAGLPAAPFRTDDWRGITAGKR
ncbi:MAG: sialate O-acetylesterase [Candidatus Brocadiaceae bacterium]|jgi:sialate O-acetylesterase